jgi:class 3 adenylate cyclase
VNMAPQRVLAAVVFTDTVGFTKRTGENEEEALGLLHADFAIMRDVAERFEGEVKKSTGDGLLIVFPSAIQAVSGAVEMQRRLGEVAKGNPRSLRHRIGIHLGDVLLSSDDVIGNGVNVANRLQGEAQPGAICMSQTVYDMVKSKLPIQAKPLGERQLRNVATTVHVYEIPPLFGVRGQKPPSIHRPSEPARRRKNSAIVSAIVFAGLCILGAAAIIAYRDMVGKPGDVASNLILPNSVKTKPGIDVKAPDPDPKGGNTPPDNTVPPTTTTPDEADKPIASQQELVALIPAKPEVKQSYDDANQQHKPGYDFDGMLSWLDAQTWAGEPGGKRLHGHWKRLKRMREDLLAALAKTSQTQPLKIGEDTYYLVTGTTLVFTPKVGTLSQLDFTELKPDVVAALARATAVDPALVRAFDVEYGLTPSEGG